MKLRYHTIKNHVDAETVSAYAYDNQLPMMQAKKMLEAETSTKLQYWDGHLSEWIDVPFVTEYRDESQTTH